MPATSAGMTKLDHKRGDSEQDTRIKSGHDDG